MLRGHPRRSTGSTSLWQSSCSCRTDGHPMQMGLMARDWHVLEGWVQQLWWTLPAICEQQPGLLRARGQRCALQCLFGRGQLTQTNQHVGSRCSAFDVVSISSSAPPPRHCNLLVTSRAGLEQALPLTERIKSLNQFLIFNNPPPAGRCSNMRGNRMNNFHPRSWRHNCSAVASSSATRRAFRYGPFRYLDTLSHHACPFS